MTDSFDPYDQWLDIPPAQQPANHYRLFGLPLFESDPEVIANVTQQVMARVRKFQIGPRSEYSQRLLNELAAARVCLKDAETKAKYDAELRAQLATPKLPPVAQTQPAVNKPVKPPAATITPPTPSAAPAVPAQSATSGKNTLQFGLPTTPAFDWRTRFVKPWSILIVAAASLSIFALGMLLGSWMYSSKEKSATPIVASPVEVPNKPPSSSEVAVGTVKKPPQERQRLFADGQLEAPPGTEAQKLVIWNQHNSHVRDRGTKACIVYLIRGDHEIWASDEIETAWKPDGPASTTVELPSHTFDRLRVEITAWHGPGGGLAELQLFDGESEISHGCPARASSSFDPRFPPATINDGITTSAQHSLGYWLLPDRVPGWIEIDVSRPAVDNSGVIADEVVLWNAHNALDNNVGTKVFDFILLRDGEKVWSQEEVTLAWEPDRDHSVSVKVPQVEFDAVRIDVRESERHAALSEIEVIRKGQNIALGCPTRASSFFDVLAKPSCVVDGVRSSNRNRVGHWIGKVANEWIEVDLSCCDKAVGDMNQQIAKYYCFQRNDWPRGLPWFARCSDAQLRLLAAKDQQTKISDSELISVADQWWELSQQASGLAQDRLKLRALQLYVEAIPGVDSFLRRRLEDRLHTEIKKFDEQDYLYFQPTAKSSGIYNPKMVRGPGCSINGKPYEYALWMHPLTKHSSRMVFFINGQYRTLTGSVAIDDTARANSTTPLVFRVEGDGESLWQSEPIQEINATNPFQVDIAGVQRLELVVDCPGSVHLAHAVWLDPRLGR